MQFYLSVGSTLSVAWFGSVGSFYLEVTKDATDRKVLGLMFALLAMITVGIPCVQCYLKAYQIIKERKTERV